MVIMHSLSCLLEMYINSIIESISFDSDILNGFRLYVYIIAVVSEDEIDYMMNRIPISSDYSRYIEYYIELGKYLRTHYDAIVMEEKAISSGLNMDYVCVGRFKTHRNRYNE